MVMDEAAEARMKIISKTYKGSEGGKPAFKLGRTPETKTHA